MSTVQIEKGEYITTEEAAGIIGCTAAHVRHLLRAEPPELSGRKLSERVWLVEKKSAVAYAKKPQVFGRPRISA